MGFLDKKMIFLLPPSLLTTYFEGEQFASTTAAGGSWTSV